MALAHQFQAAEKTAASSKRQTVLVTGAAGGIGRHFCEANAARYDLRLLDRGGSAAKLAHLGQTIDCELGDAEALRRHLAGVDTVLHLAAERNHRADWEQLLPNNIIGTYNLMTAALAAGCRKVVFASSIHAVSGYPEEVQVKTSEPVDPGDLYGVSKCFGEALGRFLAEQENLSVIAVRIGAYQPTTNISKERPTRHSGICVSPRDLSQLFVRCIDDQTLRFAIFHGVSNNQFKRLDISDARELLGYAPEDDFTETHPKLSNLDLEEPNRTAHLPK